MTTEIKPRKVLSLKKKDPTDTNIETPVISRKKTVYIPEAPVKSYVSNEPPKKKKKNKAPTGPNARNFKPHDRFPPEDTEFWEVVAMSSRLLRILFFHLSDDKGYTSKDRSALFVTLFGKNCGWVRKRMGLDTDWTLPTFEGNSKERLTALRQYIAYYAYHIACSWSAKSCNNREPLPFMKHYKTRYEIYDFSKGNVMIVTDCAGYKNMVKLCEKLRKGRENKKEDKNDV